MTPNPFRLTHSFRRWTLLLFLTALFAAGGSRIANAQDSTYTVHLPLVVQAAENSQAASQAASAADNT